MAQLISLTRCANALQRLAVKSRNAVAVVSPISAGLSPTRAMCTQKLTKVKKPKRRTVSVKVKDTVASSPHDDLGQFTVALLGRPNVGKSTLFNRLRSDGGSAGRGRAVTHKTPGTTRDWRDAPAWLAGLSFRLLDTGGVEHLTGHARRSRGGDSHITQRMRSLTSAALMQADNILFMVSARDGVTPEDEAVARWLRSVAADVDAAAAAQAEAGAAAAKKPFLSRVTVVANKAETMLHSAALSSGSMAAEGGVWGGGLTSGTMTGGASGRQVLQFSYSHDTEGSLDWMSLEAEVARLGLGPPIPLSAAHGDGLTGLVETLLPTAQASAERGPQRPPVLPQRTPQPSAAAPTVPAANSEAPAAPPTERAPGPVTLGGGQQGMLHTPRTPTGMGMELGPIQRPVKGPSTVPSQAPASSSGSGGVQPTPASARLGKSLDKRSADGSGPVPKELRVPEAGDRHRGLQKGLMGQGGFGAPVHAPRPLDESSVEGAVEAAKRRQAATERAVMRRVEGGARDPAALREQLGTGGRVSRRAARGGARAQVPPLPFSPTPEFSEQQDAQVQPGSEPLPAAENDADVPDSELTPDGSTLSEWLKNFQARREARATGVSSSSAHETVLGENPRAGEGGGAFDEEWDPLSHGIQVEGQVLSSRPDEEFRLASTPHAHWGKQVAVAGDRRVTLRDTLPDGSVGHKVRLGAHGEVTVSPKGAVLDSRGGGHCWRKRPQQKRCETRGAPRNERSRRHSDLHLWAAQRWQEHPDEQAAGPGACSHWAFCRRDARSHPSAVLVARRAVYARGHGRHAAVGTGGHTHAPGATERVSGAARFGALPRSTAGGGWPAGRELSGCAACAGRLGGGASSGGGAEQG